MLDLQDHFEALVYILAEGSSDSRLVATNSFTQAARIASQHTAEDQRSGSFDAIRPARDATFRARIASATEWTDLELLFRTLARA